MTSQQPAPGLVELMVPHGRRIFVDFVDDVSDDPDVEGDVVQTLLDADGNDGDMCEAVADYARTSGMTARFFLGRESIIVAIGDATADDAYGENGRRRYGSDIAGRRRVSAAASTPT